MTARPGFADLPPLDRGRKLLRHWSEAGLARSLPMLIGGTWPRVGFGILFADSEAGKSLYALSLAGAVAGEATEFFGAPVHRHGAVAYLAAEGQHGLAHRIAAVADRAGIVPARLPIHVHGEPVDFRSQLAVDALLAELRPLQPALVVLDSYTSHDSTSGAGAHADTAASSAFLKGLTQTAHQLGTLVLMLDHPNHQDKTRPAGSYAKKALADAMWRGYRDAKTDTLVLACEKAKDFVAPREARLRFRVIQAANGAPMLTSAHDAEDADELSLKERLSLTVVSRLSETGLGVSTTEWQRGSLAAGITRPTFFRIRRRLIDAGFVAERDGLNVVTGTGFSQVSPSLTEVSSPTAIPAAPPQQAEVSLTPRASIRPGGETPSAREVLCT